MSKYALVKENQVDNVFVCESDEIASSLFPSDIVINVNDIDEVSIGWFYSDGEFSAPLEPEKTIEELIFEAEQYRMNQRAQSDNEIVWRQDAVEAGIATNDEITALTAWKKYRVLLMRVDTSKVPNITWPDMP